MNNFYALWKNHRNKSVTIFHHIALISSLIYFKFSFFWMSISLISAYAGFAIFAHTIAHHKFSHTVYKDTFLDKIQTLGVITFVAVSSPLNFVLIHRHHHKYSDTELDPHSPKYIGWWRVYFLFWKHVNLSVASVRDMARSKFQIWIHENYIWLHFLILICLSIINIKLVVFVISPCVVYTSHVNGLVNWLGHKNGIARNIPEVAWLTPFSWKHGDHHS